MPPPIPSSILNALDLSHASWRTALVRGLDAVNEADSGYLASLDRDQYLPTQGRLFAAFAQPLHDVRYVLVGEGPYPREQSATGVCFMDGAVASLWSETGLSKQVNRATSLRNFMKMLLVAEGVLEPGNTSGDALADVASRARAIGSPYIDALPELQSNLERRGFLLLNASLVFRPTVAPVKDARAWQPFLRTVLDALSQASRSQAGDIPTLVLWGKIAEQLNSLPEAAAFPKAVSEHPYNLSFILNPVMQNLFGPMRLLFRA